MTIHGNTFVKRLNGIFDVVKFTEDSNTTTINVRICCVVDPLSRKQSIDILIVWTRRGHASGDYETIVAQEMREC